MASDGGRCVDSWRVCRDGRQLDAQLRMLRVRLPCVVHLELLELRWRAPNTKRGQAGRRRVARTRGAAKWTVPVH